ncbi:MAG: DNA-binding protein WhiA [Lachnospiraceae bacterium]|nr:DNA-binding protein WhiA [Lachnospiraceae bacterium]
MSFSAKVKEELKKVPQREKDGKERLLREAYLSGGSMSDPGKAYHLEYVCPDAAQAEEILAAAQAVGATGKITNRSGRFVVYFKEGEDIVTLLGVMGASLSLMDFENERIVKEMRGSINRRVNCETANIGKTVTAANRQLEDILYLERTGQLDRLEQTLKDVAEVRLAYPDATLAELGKHLTPPLGKSGVNHRLRRLSEIASESGGRVQ